MEQDMKEKEEQCKNDTGHLGESYFNLIQDSEKDNQKWLSFLYAKKGKSIMADI